MSMIISISIVKIIFIIFVHCDIFSILSQLLHSDSGRDIMKKSRAFVNFIQRGVFYDLYKAQESAPVFRHQRCHGYRHPPYPVRRPDAADQRPQRRGRRPGFHNRFDYQTMPQEQAIWEGHIQYADIHVLLSGQELIGVTNIDALQETVRKVEEDFVGFEGQVQSWFPMTTEDILIVFPEDIHMVKVINGESTLVEKACYKVKV